MIDEKNHSNNQIKDIFSIICSEENEYFNEPFESECDADSVNSKKRQTNSSSRTRAVGTVVPRNKDRIAKSSRQMGTTCNPHNRIQTQKKQRKKDSSRPYREKIHQHAGLPNMEVLEANQHLLAQIRSENDQLKRELKESKLELKTVQRQCKVQNVRLSKAIGIEADMPMLVDRLNAEVRSLQVQLRRKSDQTEAAERRAVEMEQRLLPLLEHRERECRQPNPPSVAEHASKRQLQMIDVHKTALEREIKLTNDLKKKIELNERTQKYEQNNSDEQIRRLRKVIVGMKAQLTDVTRQLQEKVKLLELQNIYSQRLPKAMCTLNNSSEYKSSSYPSAPSLDALHRNRADAKLSLAKLSARNRERGLSSERLDNEFNEVINRRYDGVKQDIKVDNIAMTQFCPENVQCLLNEAADALSEFNSHKTRQNGKPPNLARPSPHKKKLETPHFKPRSQNKSGDNNVTTPKKPAPATRHEKECTLNYEHSQMPITPNDQIQEEESEPDFTPVDTPRLEQPESCNTTPNMDEMNEPRDYIESHDTLVLPKKGTLWRAITEGFATDSKDDTIKTSKLGDSKETRISEPNLEKLQEELSRITERHDNFKSESAAKLLPTADTTSRMQSFKMEKKSNKRRSNANNDVEFVDQAGDQELDQISDEQSSEPDRFELCKEERLWEDLFGKGAGDLSGLASSKGYNPVKSIPVTSPSLDTSQSRLPTRGGNVEVFGRDSNSMAKHFITKTLGMQLSNSVRQQRNAKNPLEDLDVEELPI